MEEPTSDQQAIIEALQTHNVAVIARPGSGKTATARFASKANPSWNTLFLTYSRTLKESAQKDFSGLTHVDVQTIHGALSDLYKMTVNTDILLRKLRREGMKPLWNHSPYDLVIVDEAQDLNPDLYWAIRMIVSNPNGPVRRMLVLGDPQQMIYGYRDADSRYLTEYESVFRGISPGPWRCMDLDTSLRLTIPNAALANEYLGQEYVQGSNKSPSPIPLYIIANLQKKKKRGYESESEITPLLDILRPLVKQYKDDTAILAPSVHRNYHLSRVVNGLARRKSNVLFAMIRDDESSKSSKALENKVVIGTFHSLKGDDRNLVIALRADSSHRDCRPGEPCPKPIFVALTRVKEQLVLLQSHTAKIFHGTSEERLRKLTDFIVLAEPKVTKKKGATLPNISRIVRQLPMNILEEALRDVVVVEELRAPRYDGSPLRSLIPISYNPSIHEPVEDLNRNSLTEALLLKQEKKELPRNSFSFSREECRDIAHRVLENDEWESGFYFRRPQLSTVPDWLSSTGLEEAIGRVTEIIDINLELEYNYEVSLDVSHGKKKKRTLKGIVDIYDPWSQGMPTIYELRLKSQISPEDLIQLLFYGVLEAMMRRKKDPQLPRMILYNVADGQQLQLKARSFKRALEYMNKVIRIKSEPLEAASPLSTETFLQQCSSIEAEVQNAKPYSGPIKGKWWEWHDSNSMHSSNE